MVVVMGFQLFDEIVQTDYGQFDIVWGGGFGFDGDFGRFFAGQSNGLVGAADANGVYLHFGRRSGGSSVRVRRSSTSPAGYLPRPRQRARSRRRPRWKVR